jgi:peptide/nickel transport system substrate-binding protein
MRNVYEPLVVMDANDQVQPVLASGWTVSDDKRTISFTLREGVEFHDGSTLDSDDVVASLERWIAQTVSGKQFMQGTTVTATGPLTVDVTTPRAMFTTLQLLADPSLITPIQPAEVVRGAPAEGVTRFIGTGPYQFVEWVTDQFIHLRRFDGYASPPGPANGLAGAKTPVYENLFFHFVADPSTRVAGLQTGEYDAANSLPFDTIAQLQSDPNLKADIAPSGTNVVVFNKRRGVMSSPLMRQAANAALNMEEILRAAFADPQYYRLNGAIAADQSSPWYSGAGLANYNVHDPGKARRLLAEAGYAGEPVRILTTREYADHYNSAVVIEAELKAVGINAELVVTDWATLLQNRTDDTAYEAFITGFTPTVLPTRNLFLSSSWPGWTNDPAITRAMDAITYAPDEAAATAAMGELQQAVYDYLPIVKFGENSTLMGLAADVEGFSHQTEAGDIFYNVHPKNDG